MNPDDDLREPTQENREAIAELPPLDLSPEGVPSEQIQELTEKIEELPEDLERAFRDLTQAIIDAAPKVLPPQVPGQEATPPEASPVEPQKPLATAEEYFENVLSGMRSQAQKQEAERGEQATKTPPEPGATGEQSLRESRTLTDIRDLMARLVEQGLEPDEPSDERPTPERPAIPSGPANPIVERLQQTRVGRVTTRFVNQVRGAVNRYRAQESASSPRATRRPKAPRSARGGALGRVPTGASQAGASTLARGASLTAAKGGTAAAAGGAGAGAAGGAAGGGMAAAGGAAAAAGPVGLVVAGAAAAAYALYEAGHAAKDYAYQQEQAARRFAEVSPTIAQALAELDAARTFRDADIGEATGATTNNLTEHINKFEEAIKPLEIIFRDLNNMIGASLIQVLTDLIETIKQTVIDLKDVPGFAPAANRLIQAEEDAKAAGGMFGDWLKESAEIEERKARDALDRLRRAVQR